MNDIIFNTINNIVSNFDFTYCIIVNVTTYGIVKGIVDNNKTHTLATWNKRIILLIVSILVAIFYYITGSDTKMLFNSFILAPVSWSWIFKPICDKLGYGYDSKCDNNSIV